MTMENIHTMANIWFTSDHHFGHENIVEYAKRPFDSVREMDDALIEAWNSVVKPEDTVYHLGDFTLKKEAVFYWRQLVGETRILNTWWHHDKYWAGTVPPYISGVQYLPPMMVLEKPHVIVLCHYPFAQWDRKHYGAWHLHGHSHNMYCADGLILDVGVDSAYEKLGAYRPFKYSEVEEWMDDKQNLEVGRGEVGGS